MELVGINNEREFYSNHYLSEILEKDLKEVFAGWKARKEQTGARMPFEELGGLRKDYFDVQTELERTREPDERLALQRSLVEKLIEVLGYPFQPGTRETEDGISIPILGEVTKPNGAPELWILEAVADTAADIQDPLSQALQAFQLEDGQPMAEELAGLGWESIITKFVFSRPEPPRWVVLMSDSQAVLVDRGKWNDKRLLRFDWEEILGRREGPTLQAAAALLHRDSVCPEEGTSLLDSLDENSHKHAHGVSEDLKYALREAIELLGNEVILYLRATRKKGVFDSGELVDEKQLSIECLRVMYRLLFLFYVESRPELGYAPIQAEAYRLGYSLDSLRDLELVQLTTEESRNGTYIHESIQLLFNMVYEGFNPKGEAVDQVLDLESKPLHYNFSMAPLRAHLFDPKRTPTFDKVKVRNVVWQRIIELMSLSRPKGGKRRRRGRVSYAQLGINQLGAVYEALLSFSGFFARQDLYEVKSAKVKGNPDELDIAYFVPEDDLGKYTEEERVYNSDGSLRKYPKGTFIYRLAGRNRQSSASYYTPESLTKTLVKYALKELLEDEDGKLKRTADEILDITVCEPAMGSAAFLNEAINQIAELYLRKKQEELNDSIPHDAYAHELQRVKMFLADNRVFGVDLNPVAVELAEVSLWLNSIHKGGFVPWFGGQLACGNSLIGARRQVFTEDQLIANGKKGQESWLDSVPERVPLGKKRPKGSVYHFLLGDPGMSVYGQGNEGKPIREMAKQELAAIDKWRKEFCAPLTDLERKNLEQLSVAIDKLWDSHVRVMQQVREKTTDPLELYGQPKPLEGRARSTTAYKDSVWRGEVLSEGLRASSPYRRLKLAMDYWCSLWFWPIHNSDMLPTRAEFMEELSWLLDTHVVPTETKMVQRDFFAPPTMPKQFVIEMKESVGFVDVDLLTATFERFALVNDIADRCRFLHWEIEFADLFLERGGFELVLGNPPWINLEWRETEVLGDYLPEIALEKTPEIDTTRKQALEIKRVHESYLQAYTTTVATQNHLSSMSYYPLLRGIRTNPYKCFLMQSWQLTESGVTGLITDKGLYSDPRASALRQECYYRLRYHFHFKNQLRLFRIGPGDNNKEFELAVYGQKRNIIDFKKIAQLLSPTTVDACFEHDGRGPVPPIKNDEGHWDTRGHRHRIIRVGKTELTLFSILYDTEGVPYYQATLPAVHSIPILATLKKISDPERPLASLNGQYFFTQFWNEKTQCKDGTIRRKTGFASSIKHWIASGPHIYVGNPINKTPRRSCDTQNAYDVLDLTTLPEDYLARCNYVPACSETDYLARVPKVPWGDRKPVTSYYRLMFRRQLSLGGERTLIAALLPPGPSHVHGITSIAFSDPVELLCLTGLAASIVFDFAIRTAGKGDLYESGIRQLPLLGEDSRYKIPLVVRTMLLNALTSYYSSLWHLAFQEALSTDYWAKHDQRLNGSVFSSIKKKWSWNLALRTDFERRQALVEIDVLSAMALELNLDELLAIFRVHFPVLRQYEKDTWYDQNGRIVFTNSRGLSGVGLPRKAKRGDNTPCWEEVKGSREGTVNHVVIDDTLPGGPREKKITYVAPFDRCNRESDYEVVWAEFEKRFGKVRSKK